MSKTSWLLALGLFLLLLVVVWTRGSVPVGTRQLSDNSRPASTSSLTYGIGRYPFRDEIARRDLTVFPSGAGLPKGRGHAVQGERIYATQCAACHGRRGEGAELGPALTGGIGSLDTETPQRTVGSSWPYATSVFDYTRRAMPYQAPGSLTDDEVYAVTAYMLYLSGIIGAHDVLDEKTLPAVKMPNRDGFIPDPRPDVHARRR